MAKKYVWLKLKDDFFQQRAIKKLRKIAGGDTYTIIYLKLQLLSLKDEGKLFYEGVEDDFIEEMALAIDEDSDNVRITIMFLEKNGLLTTTSIDEYTLPQVINCIGSETVAAERKRQQRIREKEKLLLEQKTEVTEKKCDNVTTMSQEVTNSHTEKEEEKDKEIDDNNIYTIPEKNLLDEKLDVSSIEFKNNFLEYKELVSKSTGMGMNIIDNLMANIIHTLKSQYDIKFLIQKIKESDFLMGKLETKPSTANFSKKVMLDRIMADEYKNKISSRPQEIKSPATRIIGDINPWEVDC